MAYYLFNRLSPPIIYPIGIHEEAPRWLEYMVPSEGFFDDDERLQDRTTGRINSQPVMLEAIEIESPREYLLSNIEKEPKSVVYKE